MTERNTEHREYMAEPAGDVFTDRLYPQWPNLKGYEISEEEFRREEEKIKRGGH